MGPGPLSGAHCRAWRRSAPGAAGIRSVKSNQGGYPASMFFFSNRVGCIGSLLISAVATVVLILLLTR